MEIILGLLIVAIALIAAFWLSSRKRSELAPEDKPQKMSKREKKLAEIRANEPDVAIPTLDELVREELEETGVNEIAGHDGLTDPVKLKVYHRDIGSLGDCPRDHMTFVLAYGISAEEATENDVRLVCGEEPVSEVAADHADGADGRDDAAPSGSADSDS